MGVGAEYFQEGETAVRRVLPVFREYILGLQYSTRSILSASTAMLAALGAQNVLDAPRIRTRVRTARSDLVTAG